MVNILCVCFQRTRYRQPDHSFVKPHVTSLLLTPVDSESRSPQGGTQSSLSRFSSEESKSWVQVVLLLLECLYYQWQSSLLVVRSFINNDIFSVSGGAFRHFMWLMARELQGTHVGLLIPCPSSAANKNKVCSVGTITTGAQFVAF